MRFDADRVWANVREATTQDLLDRVTVYRDGMEPEAVTIIEAELRRRGVKQDEIDAHAARRHSQNLRAADGTAIPCSFCHRPAVTQGWSWRRVPGKWRWLPPWGLPLFPRFFSYCEEHWTPKRPKC
jgi:hypothetical protein